MDSKNEKQIVDDYRFDVDDLKNSTDNDPK